MIVLAAQEHGKSLRCDGLGDAVRPVLIDAFVGQARQQIVPAERLRGMVQQLILRGALVQALPESPGGLARRGAEAFEIGEDIHPRRMLVLFQRRVIQHRPKTPDVIPP